MGCKGSGEKTKFKMRMCGTEEWDCTFEEVQVFIDEVYRLMDEIGNSRKKLLTETEFDKSSRLNASHAIIGIALALAAASNENTDIEYWIKDDMPFIEFNKSKNTGMVINCIEAFEEYAEALKTAKEKIDLLREKSNKFVEQGEYFSSNVYKDVGNTKDLGPRGKILRRMKILSNCSIMAKMPSFANELRVLVTNCISEFQLASKELKSIQPRLIEMSSKLLIPQNKKLLLPKDCYLQYRDKINDQAKSK